MENHNETDAVPASEALPSGSPAPPPILEVRGLTKSFFGIPVLEDAHLSLHRGQVHGLMGENGAGKSTLMKVLAGVYQPDAGTVLLEGQEVNFSHPTKAHEAGLSSVFQEFNLLPDRTVAENIYLGREPRRGLLVNKALMNSKTAELLESLGITAIRPTMQVRSLTVAEQQVVEIAKAVSYDARIISMDEPTAALAGAEVELLYEIVARLRERGTAILYVSHRLREVFDLCDVITVLKDGKVVSTQPATELDDARLVRLMVGRPISAFFPDKLPREDVDADGVEDRADPRVAGRRKRPAGRDKPQHPARRDCRPGRASRVRPHGIASWHLRRRTLHPRNNEDGGRGAAAQVAAPGRAGTDGPDHRGPQG